MATSGDLEPGPGERMDALGPHRKVLQRSRGHRSGTDDVIASAMALRAAPDAPRVLDLGAGHGTLTLQLSVVMPSAEFVAVEVQDISVALLRRNLRLNGLETRSRAIHADLRDLPDDLGIFSLVVGTPPFMPVGSGVLPQDPQRAGARFELRGGIEDYCLAAVRHLAPRGLVSILMDASQDERCRRAFAAVGLALHQRWVVRPRPGRPPTYLGYIGGVEAPQAGECFVQELCVRDTDGQYSAPMSALRSQLALEGSP